MEVAGYSYQMKRRYKVNLSFLFLALFLVPEIFGDDINIKRGIANSCISTGPMNRMGNFSRSSVYMQQFDTGFVYSQEFQNVCPETIDLHYCTTQCGKYRNRYFTNVVSLRGNDKTALEWNAPIELNKNRFTGSVLLYHRKVSWLSCYSRGNATSPGKWPTKETCLE